MPGYSSLTGAELARILCGDEWKPEGDTPAISQVVLWKDSGNCRPISLSLAFPIGANRVEAICRKAGITPERFKELYLSAPQPEWLQVEPDTTNRPAQS